MILQNSCSLNWLQLFLLASLQPVFLDTGYGPEDFLNSHLSFALLFVLRRRTAHSVFGCPREELEGIVPDGAGDVVYDRPAGLGNQFLRFFAPVFCQIFGKRFASVTVKKRLILYFGVFIPRLQKGRANLCQLHD